MPDLWVMTVAAAVVGFAVFVVVFVRMLLDHHYLPSPIMTFSSLSGGVLFLFASALSHDHDARREFLTSPPEKAALLLEWSEELRAPVIGSMWRKEPLVHCAQDGVVDSVMGIGQKRNADAACGIALGMVDAARAPQAGDPMRDARVDTRSPNEIIILNESGDAVCSVDRQTREIWPADGQRIRDFLSTAGHCAWAAQSL